MSGHSEPGQISSGYLRQQYDTINALHTRSVNTPSSKVVSEYFPMINYLDEVFLGRSKMAVINEVNYQAPICTIKIVFI